MRSIVPLLLLLAACKSRAPEGSAAPPASASAAVAAPSASAETTNHRLAFQPPGGSGRADPQVVRHQEAVKRLPKLENWVLLGRVWVQKARESADPGYYLNAGACADEALSLDPRSPLALGLKAQVALNDHRFNDALDVAQQALSILPEDLPALGVKSDALLELGRFEEAASTAQRMMDLKPSLASFTRASYFRWLQGDFAGAKAAARGAANSGRSPSDPEPFSWALVQAAMLFWHVGDYEGAEAGFDKALESFADYPPALVGKARVLMTKGQPRAAIPLLEKADAQSPLVETAWLLGDARAAAGDEAGAKVAYDLVVSRGRLHDGRTLAQFYATKNRDSDEAVKLARREREQRGDIYTDDALGWALYRAGKLDEARTALDRATRLGTKDATLLYHLGAVKMAQGDKRGEALVREALKLNPKFDATGAPEASKLLPGAKK